MPEVFVFHRVFLFGMDTENLKWPYMILTRYCTLHNCPFDKHLDQQSYFIVTVSIPLCRQWLLVQTYHKFNRNCKYWNALLKVYEHCYPITIQEPWCLLFLWRKRELHDGRMSLFCREQQKEKVKSIFRREISVPLIGNFCNQFFYGWFQLLTKFWL